MSIDLYRIVMTKKGEVPGRYEPFTVVAFTKEEMEIIKQKQPHVVECFEKIGQIKKGDENESINRIIT